MIALSPSRILVLGGNGFIGFHLVDRLLAEGHCVRVFDKYEEHYRKPLAKELPRRLLNDKTSRPVL